MPPNWQRPLISAHEAEIRELIDEIRTADDIDLWEEAAAKLTDVIVVYRRAMRRQIVKFTDERQRVLIDDAFNAAFAQAFTEAEAQPKSRARGRDLEKGPVS